MKRRMCTLPQWPCSDCRTTLTRTRAYYVVERADGCGIKRKVNGAYCRACATRQAQDQTSGPHHEEPSHGMP
jgi:hypothetical protein